MRTFRRAAGAGTCLALAASSLALLTAPTAAANPAGTSLVISEAYGGGGNSGATLTNDFIELFNPTDAAISVAGMSVQYRSASSIAAATGVTPLTGSVPAHGYYLIQEAAGAAGTTPLPTPDATGTVAMSGTAFQVWLAEGTTALTPPTGTVVGTAGIVDFLGVNATSFETTKTAALSNTTSASRNAGGTDTDVNAADFTIGAPAPQNSGTTPPPPPPPPGTLTIAEIQGTDAAVSPVAGSAVTTRGVVTAAYPTGGFNGFYIQTPGTGGAPDATPGASDAIFVFGSAAAATVHVGDFVEVTGTVAEFKGASDTGTTLTEISTSGAAAVTVLPDAHDPVAALSTALPSTEAAREQHEGELVLPTGPFTVTDNFDLNAFGEIGLAAGTTTLVQPTEVQDAQTGDIAGVKADNAARAVSLDDGSSINFLSNSTPANKNIPLPWVSVDNPVRVGSSVTFTAPVVLDYRNSLWKFQPTTQLTAAGTPPVTFSDTRADNQTPQNVGGDVRLATFNVLNFFPTTGAEYVAGGGTCTFFNDRAGNPITVNDCGLTGPRGAADDVNLARQQAKIVAAINRLGASIVSLEEIENSVHFGKDRDFALARLVDALNTATGSTVWAYAPSPAAADLPALAEQDVIRTAFIYKPADVELVGASKVLVGEAAFNNAREPLAQAFKAKGAPDSDAFAVIVNHFKSKGSGVDDGTGQGNANPDRIAQANALVRFANDFATARGTSKVLLTGDFNSYSQEDPMQVLYGAGYTAINSSTAGESTYNFDGMSGSLDHVLANAAALPMVTGADIWNINSVESVGFEYSRYNYNATLLYQDNQFRASDHDPEIVGLDLPAVSQDVTLNLVGINDFHGRINANTVKWAGTVESLLADGTADTSLLIGAGDLIGASEFASASAGDQPTIDVLNTLGLDASAVGNHEFDRGYADLRDRVINNGTNASWKYLGANVYAKGTQNPVLPSYAEYTVGGVKVAVVGAVTSETASLVSPAGIADIEFGDPVAAINRVAGELSDGNPANGEASVIIATLHAGATQGVGSTYDEQVALGGEFASMANLSPNVDVIFNGHTHQVYAWDAPVPGQPGVSRPILQTGSYGDNVGQVSLTVNKSTGDVVSYTSRNVARTTTPDATLITQFPVLATVKTTVDNAIAAAAVIGNTPVGSVTADITTAFSGGTYTGGLYAGGVRDDRLSESALGDLVANALRDGLPADAGPADIGIVNPGGLRAELFYAGNTASNPANTDGVVTFAEANSVLPFLNNIWTVRLTGAQLKAVLEQQWQPAGAQRPFLALGLSDNVRVLQDPANPAGSRITAVYVNDQLLDPAATYTVSTFSFLATGGDNFTAFKAGTSTDTGLLDRDLWIQYLTDHPGLAPDFARQQVQVAGVPSSITAGDAASITLSKLNLTSQGSPANTSVTAMLTKGSASVGLGSFPVTDGSAVLDFTVPLSLEAGAWTLTATASPSATTVSIPLAVAAPVPVASAVSLTLSAASVAAGDPVTASVTVTAPGLPAGVTPTGTVTVLVDGVPAGTGTLAGGQVSVAIGPFTTVGTRSVVARYEGDPRTEPSESAAVRLTVGKATPTVTTTLSSSTVVRGTGRVTATVTVSTPADPSGVVRIYVGRKLKAVVRLVDGQASAVLGPFGKARTYTVVATYSGDANNAAASADPVTLTVVNHRPHGSALDATERMRSALS